jgi:hypothetical protein
MEELRVEILRLLRLQTWEGIDEAIKLLVQSTGKGLLLDPFENPDGLYWNEAGLHLRTQGLYQEALTLFQAFLASLSLTSSPLCKILSLLSFPNSFQTP